MEYELLPCPFCGGDAKVKMGSSPAMGANDKTASVVCIKSGCRTKEEIEWGNDFIGVAIKLWNTRIRKQTLCE